MKTRIKEVVLKNGTSVFYGQYRRFGIWRYIKFEDRWGHDEFESLEEAQRQVDAWIKKQSEIQGQKKAKTVYHRYP